MFLKENNIDCVGFSQREHFIERRKSLDKFLTGEVEYKLLKTSQRALTQKLQVKIISATDLMSRGLDTHDVSIFRNILVVEFK